MRINGVELPLDLYDLETAGPVSYTHLKSSGPLWRGR